MGLCRFCKLFDLIVFHFGVNPNIFYIYKSINFVRNLVRNLSINLNAMRVLLDIKDNKALPLLEVLKGLSYVKTKTISEEKALLMEEMKESIENLILARKGKLKLKSARDLYNEL